MCIYKNTPTVVHSINNVGIYYLQAKCGGKWKNSSQGASEWFILFWGLIIFLFLDPRQLDEENNKKIKTLSISCVVAENLPNHIEMTELLIFFFTRKIYFLLPWNFSVIKTEHFLIIFWCPFPDAIIGFEKLLNFVNILR